MTNNGRVLLAYSGGLDTSTILAWLIDEGYEVIAYMANVGQEEDFEAVRAKAIQCGAKDFILDDVRREFVEELIFPAVQANAIYEDVYLLGTSLARPVIARGMIETAAKMQCEYVSHGCTGKGNDQVRFELAFYGLNPDIKRFAGRSDLLEYAASKGIPVTQTKAKPWSTDENLFHISYEAGILEDPNTTPPADMWKLTQAPEKAPEVPEHIKIDFTNGVPSRVTLSESGESHTDSVDVFMTLNALARKHGIGRVDIVENRFIGVKSRGCYESPGATILRAAHIDLEGLTLDREVRRIRDQLVTTKLSEILYYGFFFSPESQFVRGCIPASQKTVNGTVKVSLYKGNVIIEGRSSEELLYDEKFSSMDEMGGFEPENTTGFIAVQSIRLRRYGLAQNHKGLGGSDPKRAYSLEVPTLMASLRRGLASVRYYVTQAMSVEASIRSKLTEAFAPSHIFIRNDSSKHAHHAAMVAQGGGSGETHFFVELVSEAFQGKTHLARHRAVNTLLAPEYERGLHALSMRLKTPAEVEKEN